MIHCTARAFSSTLLKTERWKEIRPPGRCEIQMACLSSADALPQPRVVSRVRPEDQLHN